MTDAPLTAACVPEKFSSRVCERGTKGCNVEHDTASAAQGRIKGLSLSYHTGNDPAGPTGRLMGRFRVSRETYERTMRAFGKEPK